MDKETKDLKIKKKMFVDTKIEQIDYDVEDDRVLTFSFASMIPYLRDFGYEIIDTKNMILDRLNNKAPLLFNHDFDDYVGVINKAFYNDSDQRCYCNVRFDTHKDAEKIYNSVKNGILTHVSFGYQIISAKFHSEIDGIDAYLCEVDAYEVSIVTVAADDKVGIGRSLEEKQEDFILKIEKTENFEKKLDEEVDLKNKIDDNKNIHISVKKQEEKNMDKIQELIAIGKKYKKEAMALDFIERGLGVNELVNAILEETTSKPSNSKSDDSADFVKEGYDAGLALKALLTNDISGVVKETNDALERKFTKRSERSILIPFSAIRGVTAGNQASAGVLSETHRSGNFIESLMNNLAIVQAGATYLPDLVGDFEIPKFNNIINAQYVGENQAATESDLDASMIKLTGKDLSANISISRKMKLQTSYNIQQICFNQIYNALRAKMDIEALMGTGANGTVKGLLNLDGIGSVTTTGGKPTWLDVLNLEAQVKSKNALINKGCYISNSNVESLLKGTQKGNGLGFIHDGLKVNGYDLFTTNALKIQQTVGETTTVTNPLIFGDFSQMYVGNWGVLEIMYDPYTLSSTGQERLTAFVTFDVGVAHEQSFSVIKDITV